MMTDRPPQHALVKEFRRRLDTEAPVIAITPAMRRRYAQLAVNNAADAAARAVFGEESRRREG